MTNNHNMLRFLLLNLLVMIVCINTSSAFAKDYKVEVLIFENKNEHSAYESNQYVAPEKIASESATWKIAPTMLNEQASIIRKSQDYRLLKHFSWGQESLPYSKSATFEVAQQQLNGWIKIYATHLLFANIDIDFNGYRMTEKRRLKLNEKHFFDHPKFGLLVQVSRLEKEPEIVE